MLLIDSTFPGSNFRPVELIMCPKNGSSEQPILHLSALKHNAGFVVSLHDSSQVVIMLCSTFAIDDNVVGDASDTWEVTKSFVDLSLKEILSTD